jgi:hypothetical protein
LAGQTDTFAIHGERKYRRTEGTSIRRSDLSVVVICPNGFFIPYTQALRILSKGSQKLNAIRKTAIALNAVRAIENGVIDSIFSATLTTAPGGLKLYFSRMKPARFLLCRRNDVSANRCFR